MTGETSTKIPHAWYEDYFKDRVLPVVNNAMEECGGLFSWLAEKNAELYNRILAAEDEIDILWKNGSEQQSFKDACKSWFELLKEAKKTFGEYNTRKLAEERQPSQKMLALK